MVQNNKKYLIVVCGPTAIGKTALAITLAKKFHTEIISADSRQFFKEMSIGTAKPTPDELAEVHHHLIGHISITEEYNAGQYELQALKIANELFLRCNIAIAVGGSGLYINALCDGIDEIPATDPEIRVLLNRQFETEGLTPLLERLLLLDPEFYLEVDRSNHIRIIRALEVCLSTGKTFSSYRKKEKKKREFEIVKIGLNTKREVLYERINKRVDKMLSEGLVAEVKSLEKYKHLNALKTVGYSELFDHFDSITNYETAIDLIKQHTRNFAKRQITWFNKDKGIRWFEPDEANNIIKYVIEATEMNINTL